MMRRADQIEIAGYGDVVMLPFVLPVDVRL